MNERFSNAYDDKLRADAYSKLEFPGTYYLAFRDLPGAIGHLGQGQKALDFGCGTGRSSRFLCELGFDTLGVDVAEHMVARAREHDPQGEYRIVPDGDLNELPSATYDLVLSVFTFDNIPTMEKKVVLFKSFKRVLKHGGRIVNLVSSPDVYMNEWASFSTKDFPENRTATSGDKVRIVVLDMDDKRPVEDVLWTDADYQEVFRRAELTLTNSYRPLGTESEPYEWVSETTIAPWVIYVLERGEQTNKLNCPEKVL